MTQPLDPHTAAMESQRQLEHYLTAERLQHARAQELLAQNEPDYSGAATACHRAHQFHRQAEAVAQLRLALGLVLA